MARFTAPINEAEPLKLAIRILDVMFEEERRPAVHETALRLVEELLPYRTSRFLRKHPGPKPRS